MKKSIALIMAVLVLMTTLLSNTVFAANEPAFVASNVTGEVGDTVEVTVSTVNNPGVMSLKVYVGYDEEVLELVSATPGASFDDTSFGPTTKNPFNMVWDGSTAGNVNEGANNTANDVIATLTFKILDTAAVGKSDITLSYPSGFVYNNDWEDIDFATVAGSVTVKAKDYTVAFPEATYSNGSNIRLETEDVTPGLRFAATLTKKTLGINGKYKYEEDADMKFGMLLLPTYLLEASEYDSLGEYFLSGNTTSILNVVAEKYWAQDDDYITYTAVLTGIPEGKWETEIEAVPYMLKDGEYYFAEADKMQKSYYGVAKEAREGEYADSKIAAITDPDKKAEAQTIADNLQKIIDAIDKEEESEDPDGPGWLPGWH